MDTTKKSALHPLLTVAAISVTVLSAVGVAALTGLLPHSVGSSRIAEPIVQTTPRVQAAKPARLPAVKPVHKSAPRNVAPRAADPDLNPVVDGVLQRA